MHRLQIGQIVKVKGLKGEVKVKLETDFPERLKERKRLWIGDRPETATQINVRSVALSPNFATYGFVGIETPEQAQKLVGKSLFVETSNLPKLNGDRAYIHELIGLKVLNNQTRIGTLIDVIKIPANDVYEVSLNDGKKILIPAISDFVEEVNLTEGYIKVKRYEEFL